VAGAWFEWQGTVPSRRIARLFVVSQLDDAGKRIQIVGELQAKPIPHQPAEP